MPLSDLKCAELMVRLLLGRASEDDLKQWRGMDWPRLTRLAAKNVVLIRCHEKLNEHDVAIPSREYEETVQREKERIGKMLGVIAKIERVCVSAGIKFVLIKSFQHYPDMGGDIDLVTADPFHVIDCILEKEFSVSPLSNNLVRWISGESNFILEQFSTSIEIHHGRLGLTGEHPLLPRLMVDNRKFFSVDGIEAPIPSEEDRLLSQVIHRMYGHFYIRISDFIDAVSVLQSKNLNWEYLIDTAKKMAVTKGLSAYAGYVNDIYEKVVGEPLVSPQIFDMLGGNKYGKSYFDKSYYRYPMLGMTGNLYLTKFVREIGSGRLHHAARMGLLPAVVLSRLAGNICGRKSRFFDSQ